MGEVFRARDRVSGEAVAVKVISDGRGHRRGRWVLAEVLRRIGDLEAGRA